MGSSALLQQILQFQQMKTILIIFPHQLFKQHPGLDIADEVVIIEEYLFFRQYPFHKSKLAYHRACMKAYEDFLNKSAYICRYIESQNPLSDIRLFIDQLGNETLLAFADPCDNWLENRIISSCKRNHIEFKSLSSPQFLNSKADLFEYQRTHKRLFQTEFYIQQRKQRHILIDSNQQPLGGKWSFDQENRLRYPKGKQAPLVNSNFDTEFSKEAIRYVDLNFDANPGKYNKLHWYPHTFEQAESWLEEFIQHRLSEFGHYEDAIVGQAELLHHSLLTPALNCGLLTPEQVIHRILKAYNENTDLPLNSIEGLIRQILGWREFIRLVYVCKGSEERTKNFWNFNRPIPPSFWDGTTGIRPIDLCIKKVLNNAYCHHIERLMVLGNFMLLCEFDPDEVYCWFMVMFIDAYDWVMVPNVYGMSQFADGGLMATKPYISGSNYLKKMSDFEDGKWVEIWDALFWHFISKQSRFFESNPRLSMMLRTWNKMEPAKQEKHLRTAEIFLESLNSVSSNQDPSSTVLTDY